MLKKLREPTIIVTPEIIEKEKDLVLDVIGRCQAYLKQNNAFAIAANQIGSNLRILCYRLITGEVINCINPEILKADHEILLETGDVSFPGLSCRVMRHTKIKVRYIQADGELKVIEKILKAGMAYGFQHCLDLLNNIIIFDKAEKGVRWKPEYPKIFRSGKCGNCNNGRVVKDKDSLEIRWIDCPECNGTGQSGTMDYYIEGENVMWFSELKIDPDAIGGTVVGVKYDVQLKEEPKSKIITL